ncbi:MAG: 3-hydroxyacyl-CoA dehydrogenase NAD-binding domain-containing protein, partial [Hyphomicrobiaceae bacterium]
MTADTATSGNPIRTVGIIGAGQMGNGIAHVSAIAGYSVTISDLRPEAYEKAIASITKNMTRQVSRGMLTDTDMADAIGRISYTKTLDGFAETDLIIEAATENESVKRKIFQELCP